MIDTDDLRAKCAEALRCCEVKPAAFGGEYAVIRLHALVPVRADALLARLEEPRGAGVTTRPTPIARIRGALAHLRRLAFDVCEADDAIDAFDDLEHRARALCRAVEAHRARDPLSAMMLEQSAVSRACKQLADALGEERE